MKKTIEVHESTLDGGAEYTASNYEKHGFYINLNKAMQKKSLFFVNKNQSYVIFICSLGEDTKDLFLETIVELEHKESKWIEEAEKSVSEDLFLRTLALLVNKEPVKNV